MREIEIDIEVHKAIEGAREKFSDTENDILKRLLKLNSQREHKPASKPTTPKRTSNILYSVVIGDHLIESSGMTECYLDALKFMQLKHPKVIAATVDVKFPRGKMISKDKESLFVKSPHLRSQFCVSIGGGYWADSNLSAQQTKSRLEALARCSQNTNGPTIDWSI